MLFSGDLVISYKNVNCSVLLKLNNTGFSPVLIQELLLQSCRIRGFIQWRAPQQQRAA